MAVFRSVGIRLSFKHKLNKFVKGLAILSLAFLKINTGMPEIPAEVLLSN